MQTQAHKDIGHGNGTHAQANAGGKGTKIAYAVTERNGRSFWNRIGVAFINKDGSINVKLEAVPVTGQLQLRDWEPRDDAPSTGAGSGTRAAAGGGGDTILTELPF